MIYISSHAIRPRSVDVGNASYKGTQWIAQLLQSGATTDIVNKIPKCLILFAELRKFDGHFLSSHAKRRKYFPT